MLILKKSGIDKKCCLIKTVVLMGRATGLLDANGTTAALQKFYPRKQHRYFFLIMAKNGIFLVKKQLETLLY